MLCKNVQNSTNNQIPQNADLNLATFQNIYWQTSQMKSIIDRFDRIPVSVPFCNTAHITENFQQNPKWNFRHTTLPSYHLI